MQQTTVFNGNCHKFNYNLYVSKYFIIFDHIYKKKIHSLLFSIEGASNFFGGAMHAYAPP